MNNKPIKVYLNPDSVDEADRRSQEHGISRNAYINLALNEKLRVDRMKDDPETLRKEMYQLKEDLEQLKRKADNDD